MGYPGPGTGHNLYEKTWFLIFAPWGRLWKWSGLSELSREERGLGTKVATLETCPKPREPMGQHEPANILGHPRSLIYIYLSLLETFLLKFRSSALLPGNRQVMTLSLLPSSPFKTDKQIRFCSWFPPSRIKGVPQRDLPPDVVWKNKLNQFWVFWVPVFRSYQALSFAALLKAGRETREDVWQLESPSPARAWELVRTASFLHFW